MIITEEANQLTITIAHQLQCLYGNNFYEKGRTSADKYQCYTCRRIQRTK